MTAKTILIPRRPLGSAVAALLAIAALAICATPAAAAGPAWTVSVTPDADYFVPGPKDGTAVYTIEAENTGTQKTSESQPIAIEDVLPAGLEATGVRFYGPAPGSEYPGSATNLGPTMCAAVSRCEYPGAPVVQPGEKLTMLLSVGVPASFPEGPIEDHASVSGGGATTAEASATNTVSADPLFGFHAFTAPISDSSEGPFTQAGGHPFQFVTQLDFSTKTLANEDSVTPVGDPKNVASELPAGLIGDPLAVPRCSLADYFASECPISTVVGNVGVRFAGWYHGAFLSLSPLFNLRPTGAYPGELGFAIAGGLHYLLTAGLRSGSDYGLTVTSTGSPEPGLSRAMVTVWGVPANPAHDAIRGKDCRTKEIVSVAAYVKNCEAEFAAVGQFHGGPAEAPELPFLTLPTQCSSSPLRINARYNSWEEPSREATASYEDPAVDGCNQLSFEPSIEARPTTNAADSPSGMDFRLHLPQNSEGPGGGEDPNGVATSDLASAVVKLPQGFVVNPSSAVGLAGCSPSQVGLKTPAGATPAHFTEEPAHCPDASKLGTVEVNTPLLQNPLLGDVYLATPDQNPSGALLAGYIVLEGEGVIVKLAGQFHTDPSTGQITASFTESPPTPFEDFRFHFFEGARGALRTPATCGVFEATSVLTPYSAPESGPPAEPTSAFEITSGSGGGACLHQVGDEPNAPTFRAGTESVQAGQFTPFSLRLAREDGSQEIEKIETTLPPGLTAKLAGVGECPEAQIALAQSREHEGGGAEEQASPSCPASSEVGEVSVASGAGPTPLYVSGKAYLAGPYKGAPLSLVIITPAVAGPFDLGDVVVRTALYTAPYTAEIRAVSDPLPHILAGIPLDVRSITLKMTRPNFTLNPTNCEEMGFAGSETSLLGNVAPLSQRFQVGGCQTLPFKPKLAISLKGGTKRSKFPALTATLTMPPGQANIASAQVTLPHNAQLEQAHITSQVCLQAQLATRTCPPASVYGYAKAVTPLLDHPLEGPVYLGVGFGHKLPDLVAELNGQIRVLLHGKVDTGREDGIRNTFEVVPDAPVSKFTLHMFGGRKGLIVNSENLCGKHAKHKALATFTAQSGKVVELEPTVRNSCKKGGKGKKGKGKHKHRGGGKRAGR